MDDLTKNVMASVDDEFSVAAPKPAQPVTEPAPAPAPEPAQKCRQEIDLGDGSGVQVFEADNPQALIEKLAEAQKNATRKIRELNRLVKLGAPTSEAPRPRPIPQPRDLTAEQRFLLAQKMQEDPQAAFDMLMEARLGMTPQEFAERAAQEEAERQARIEEYEARAFMDATPEYYATPRNSDALLNYLQANQKPITAANLAAAYDALAASGILETEPETDSEPRIEARPQATVGLSDRQQARVETPSQPVFDADEFRKLSPTERRARIEQMWWAERQKAS